MITVQPFRIAVPDGEVIDLRARLRATRWADTWADQDWSYGVDQAFLRDLCRYWGDEYDWRQHEAQLNQFPQYRTHVDGARLHFLDVRSPEPDALPLVMTHGWPGSMVEFVKVLGPLTDPVAHGGHREDAFHVVCPSIPGFGFSGPTTGPGWDTRRVARALAELMDHLGYERYGTQGGDWGASIAVWLGLLDPEHILGVHINTVPTTNVSIYWFTRTATSAARLYYEAVHAGTNSYLIPKLELPTGCAIFPAEIATPSRRWAELRYNVVHYNRLARGGHFAAYEAPDIFAEDVRSIFGLLRGPNR